MYKFRARPNLCHEKGENAVIYFALLFEMALTYYFAGNKSTNHSPVLWQRLESVKASNQVIIPEPFLFFPSSKLPRKNSRQCSPDWAEYYKEERLCSPPQKVVICSRLQQLSYGIPIPFIYFVYFNNTFEIRLTRLLSLRVQGYYMNSYEKSKLSGSLRSVWSGQEQAQPRHWNFITRDSINTNIVLDFGQFFFSARSLIFFPMVIFFWSAKYEAVTFSLLSKRVCTWFFIWCNYMHLTTRMHHSTKFIG